MGSDREGAGACDPLDVETRNRVLHVRFNRPDQMNALDDRMAEGLGQLFRDFSADQVNVVVLSGAGGNFMAGADLSRLEAWREMRSTDVVESIGAGFTAADVARLSLPVVAAVDGVALGIGFDLCLAADVVIATDRAVFGLPEVDVGLVPLGGSARELIGRIGLSRANRIIMLGERVRAEQAREWGLVASVVAPDDLEFTVDSLLKKLLSRSQTAMQAAKRLLRAAPVMSGGEAAEAELNEFVHCLGEADVVEGIAAVRQRRRPNFEAPR